MFHRLPSGVQISLFLDREGRQGPRWLAEARRNHPHAEPPTRRTTHTPNHPHAEPPPQHATLQPRGTTPPASGTPTSMRLTTLWRDTKMGAAADPFHEKRSQAQSYKAKRPGSREQRDLGPEKNDRGRLEKRDSGLRGKEATLRVRQSGRACEKHVKTPTGGGTTTHQNVRPAPRPASSPQQVHDVCPLDAVPFACGETWCAARGTQNLHPAGETLACRNPSPPPQKPRPDADPTARRRARQAQKRPPDTEICIPL